MTAHFELLGIGAAGFGAAAMTRGLVATDKHPRRLGGARIEHRGGPPKPAFSGIRVRPFDLDTTVGYPDSNGDQTRWPLHLG